MFKQNGSSTSTSNAPLIDMQHISKTYKNAAGDFTALTGVNIQVSSGEFVAVVGKSGSGKTTLLNMLTGIDRPTGGEVYVNGTAVHELNEDQLAIWRGKNIGVVFQFFQLLPTLTVAENVMLPMDFCNTYPSRQRRPRALELLELVDVAEQANKLPATLSGGQQQRVAIARALANDPSIIATDEPTGNLDSHTSEVVFNLFSRLVKEGKTLWFVTHERDIARWVSRTITLVDGQVAQDTLSTDPQVATVLEEGVYA